MSFKRLVPWLLALAALAMIGSQALAQETSTGTLEGRVTDDKGTAVPGATIMATGSRGNKGGKTGADGRFTIPFLPPGNYDVKVEMAGFATIIIKDVEVQLNRRTNLPVQMSAGKTETVEVKAEAPLIDMKQTSMTTNIKIEDFVQYLPIGRNYSDTFAIAPGVVSGGGTGSGNYSVSGSSGLENQYIIDGVNITNTGYGGIGSYNTIYGSLGTGVTTDFLEEVQVKTGGFEAEFGGATGGILNSIVKTGTNDFTGAVSFYFKPRSLQSTFNKIDLSIGAVSPVDQQSEDLGLSVGGPIIKDKLFYFAAFNPVRTKDRFEMGHAKFDPDLADPGITDFPAAKLGPQDRERRSNNYAAKLSWYISTNHRLEFTAFGDPSHGLKGPQLLTSDPTDPQSLQFIDYAQGGGQSEIRYGGNNYAVKYNGVFSPNFFSEFQVSLHDAKFRETPILNENRRRFRQQQLCFNGPNSGANYCEGTPKSDSPAIYYSGGTGFISNADDQSMEYLAKLTNVIEPWHLELKYGIDYYDIEYTDSQAYTGEPLDYFIPFDVDLDGDIEVGEGDFLKSTSGQTYDKRRDTDFRVNRNRFNPFPGPTKTKDLNIFAQGTWTVTPRVVIKPGVRITKQKIDGSGDPFTIPWTEPIDPVNDIRVGIPTLFKSDSYEFPTEFAPRLGATWDINGDGRSKLYASLGRYFERIPNDLAVRSLSTEISTSRYRFLAELPGNIPTNPQAATNPGSLIFFQGLFPTEVAKSGEEVNLPGGGTFKIPKDTQLPYKDEAILGYAYQIHPNLALEVRGIYRKQGRTLEDVQFATNESIQNFYYGAGGIYGYPYDPFGGSPAQPLSTAYPADRFGAYFLANPGENTPKGLFPEPTNKYKALEVIVNRRLSDHWLAYANYRYSRLRGNYEGLFRNDNTQSDPNITSLFDLPFSPTTRGQYEVGNLNLDRPHVLNLYSAYVWDNGLTIGGSFNWSSGIPRTPLLAHPTYINSGELPGREPVYFWWTDPDGDGVPQGRTGPSSDFYNDPDAFIDTPILFDYTDCKRGCLGRTPDTVTVNATVGYNWKIGDTSLELGMSVFNLFDSKEPTRFDDNVELTAGSLDPDFLRISGYQIPRTYSFSARWQF